MSYKYIWIYKYTAHAKQGGASTIQEGSDACMCSYKNIMYFNKMQKIFYIHTAEYRICNTRNIRYGGASTIQDGSDAYLRACIDIIHLNKTCKQQMDDIYCTYIYIIFKTHKTGLCINNSRRLQRLPAHLHAGRFFWRTRPPHRWCSCRNSQGHWRCCCKLPIFFNLGKMAPNKNGAKVVLFPQQSCPLNAVVCFPFFFGTLISCSFPFCVCGQVVITRTHTDVVVTHRHIGVHHW